MTADERHMRRAIALARRGAGKTSPNPMVGAVVVADDQVVGEGWHREVGGPHAEVEALRKAGRAAHGATIYVSLEPCVHHGRTPPCSEAVIASGIARVVVGPLDPDPRVAGKGIMALREAGLEVLTGVASELCVEANSAYMVHRTKGRPEVTSKTALSMDGKVAAADGSSQWITSEAARAEGHRLRGLSDAICVGVGTVISDNPMLTTRHVKGRSPIRVVIDTHGRTPLNSRVLNDEARTLVFTSQPAPGLVAAGAEVFQVGVSAGRVSVKEVLGSLAEMGVLSVLLEGGPTIASTFLAEDLIDRFVFFVAPKLLGGPVGMLSSWQTASLGEARELEIVRVRRLGPDLMITATRKERD